MNFKQNIFFVLFTMTLYSAQNVSEYEQKLIGHVKSSIEESLKHNSKLTSDVIKVPGYTSTKVKCLLNNVCSLKGATYLEIGVFKGATFAAALYNNKDNLVEATAIDNWSQFGGPESEFIQNCSKFISDVPYKFYNSDCFKINIKDLVANPVQIYFYDGGHEEEEQEKAFTYYNSLFDNSFIAIVDDWNWNPVKIGTKKAFEKLNYKVLFEQELPANFNGDTNLWWNGIYIAVIRKNNNY